MSTKSKFFRVATEGVTADKRTIDRTTLEQVAATFNQKTYGARVWLEHIRGILPDGQFKALGDVIAVKAEEVDTDSGKKLALFAQIEPTPELIAINKASQKIYTSMEIDPDFADSGKAYLIGLGVTDTPASLGTEALQFSAGRKQSPENIFTAGVEITLEFEEEAPAQDAGKLAEFVKRQLAKFTAGSTADKEKFSDITGAVEALTAHVVTTGDNYAAAVGRIGTLETQLQETKTELAAFKKLMDEQERPREKRPPATGGNGGTQTDF